jgi:energy-coupling factor transport system substrate-specific component
MPNKYILLTIFCSLILNFSGTVLQQYVHSPLFLDTTGTMLSAVLLGPWIGGLVGLLTNTLQGIVHSPVSIPFGLVNLGVGLTAGYLAVLIKGYSHWYAPLAVGIACGIIAPLLAAPIAAYLFGGITAHGVDKAVAVLADGGRSILSSAFWGRLPFSIIDKLISSFIVFFLVRWLPCFSLSSPVSKSD